MLANMDDHCWYINSRDVTNGDILSIFFSYELGYINKKLSHFQSDYLLLQLVLESPLFASSEIDKLVH